MKKIFFCIVFIGIGWLTTINSLYATPVPPVRTMDVPFATQPPILDGVLDYMYGPEQTTDWIWPDQQPGYEGPFDYTAVFNLCWDYDYLYLLATITDDVMHNFEWEYYNAWMFDCIELFLQLDTNTVQTWYTETTVQLRITRGHVGIESYGHASPEDFAIYWEQSATGWITEVAIPWTCVLAVGSDPSEIENYIYEAIGFDFTGSDSDNSDGDVTIGNRDYMTAWDLDGQDGSEDNAWNNPSYFGYMTLLMDGPPPPPPTGLEYVEPVQVVEIPEATLPVTINGYDDEAFYGRGQSLEVFNTANWEGGFDLDGYFRTCWDYEYLYIFASITDPEDRSWQGGSYGSLYDNLEVYLDLDTFCTDVNYRSNSTAMVRFCRGNDMVETTGRAGASEFQYAWRNLPNGSGWAMEAAIPWTAALASGSSSGDIVGHLPVIGFDVIVNDLDDAALIPREEHSQLVFDLDDSEIPDLILEDEALFNTRTFGLAILEEGGLPVPELINDEEIKLYPNPTAKELHLSGLTHVEFLDIVTISGQVVQQIANPEENLRISISEFAPGTYCMRFYSSDGLMVTKLFLKGKE